MKRIRLALLVALVTSCGVETTSFRTTDKTDASNHGAVYDVRIADELVANVHVWSNGGYVGNSEEPMTHVGFELVNPSPTAISFDGDRLDLVVFDNTGAMLSPTKFTAITPLGPSQVPIAPGATVKLDSYFQIPVRPRVIDHMDVHWSLHRGDHRIVETTSFVRDDDYPVLDYRPEPSQIPRS